MPIFKNRTVFELALGVKAFLNLDAGVTRGQVPELEPTRSPAHLGLSSPEAREELERVRRKLKAREQEIARLRTEHPRGEEAAGVRPENMVWMFGMARTGSTWLSHMMGDLNGYSGWYEPLVGALFGHQYYGRVWDKQREGNNFILANKHKDSWLSSIRTFVLNEATVRFPDVAGDGYLVIAEPNGSIGAPLLMEALPESRMIFLIRDPRDVVASSLDGHKEGGVFFARKQKEREEGKATKVRSPNAHVKSSAEKYLQFIGNSRIAFDAHSGPKVLVRYEQLRAHTLDTMKHIYSTLGLPVDEGELTQVVEKHAWENIPEKKKGEGKFFRKATPGGWQEDLSPEQVKIVEDITDPLLKEFYPD
jgi:hypothetical protein